MTDIVQKIREEVERLKGWNNNVRNSTRHMTLQEEDFNRGKHSSYLEILNFIDSLQEEPVSEELEEEIAMWMKEHFDRDMSRYSGCYLTTNSLLEYARHFANWQKKQDQETIEVAEDHAMLAGMEKMKEQMMKNLWKPADGDRLPDIDREVIALLDNGKVVFAHRPPEYWDGKDIVTGKVTRNYPKTYGEGGWNIPNVKYWLDVELPKEIER